MSLPFDPPPAKKLKQTSMGPHIFKTTPEERRALDEQVGRLVYATNSSFRFVEHPEFIKLVEMLRPGYKPPSRDAIGGTILNHVYNEEIEKCKQVLSGSAVCLSLDGWSNIHNDPIVCTSVVNDEGKFYLLDTIDTSGHPHTADYLLELCSMSIKNASEKFQAKVVSVVTDNTGNVKKMR